ncbi:nitrate- and nitrite sensing domain-containing protein [Streptomyces sp. NPDC050560]|uniref:nitrate- and nitrite sensing domain-containing protein n=1 Tax=Streptomyces sp. NPDC050560 TaxID=3365630 RepID=UPI00378FF67B
MRFRGKTIRRKIVALLLVPLLSLTAIWGFATVLTGREAARMLGTATVVDKIGYPVEDTARVLESERRQTLVYLADPRSATSLDALGRSRAATDKVVRRVRSHAADGGLRDKMSAQARRRLDALLEELDGLGSLRESVRGGMTSSDTALDLYSRMIDPCYGVLTTIQTVDNVDLAQQGRAIVAIGRARELLSEEDALVSAALVEGRLAHADIRQISDLIAQRTLLYDVNLELLPDDERDRFQRYWQGPATRPLRLAEEALSESEPGPPRVIDAAEWNRLADPVLDGLADRDSDADDRYQDRVQPVATGIMVRAGVAGILGLAALLFSVILSVRVGRGLIRDLHRLRTEAHESSGVRLPAVMRRLAAGEEVDVETEAPRLEYERSELGQVGRALNTLQRAAVEAAVKQAELRRGVSEVFVNLARRSQVLLHKQLTLLDSMERRTEDTDELADLFRLDHLTTRMRRHAEGLVILSGAAPSRQWRRPVQLMDVVRASVAEVEDYERIEVRRLPRLAVIGPAVADLTHLVAELLENATVFSPPHTTVQVVGEHVANGFTLEIHDRGLGLSPDLLLDANLRLAETPEFELSDTDRLGLFVVARLARRQNVRVSLQPSPYGGTTAVVFIPDELLTEPPDQDTASLRIERALNPEDERRPAAGGPRRAAAPAPGALDGPARPAPLAPAPASGDAGATGDTAAADDTGEQHQQPPDRGPGTGEPARARTGEPGAKDAPRPLPRRRTPKLVSSHGRPVQRRGPGAAGPRPEPAAPDDTAAPSPAPADPGTAPGALPRRVRQASLAPQLKNAPAAAPAPAPEPGGGQDTAERDADEVRSRMASLQRGWQRGRRENTAGDTAGDDTAGGAAEPGPAATGDAGGAAPDSTAEQTTHEGEGR